MRGDVVYRIYGTHEGRAKDNYFGAYRTEAAAREYIAELEAREMDGANWARRYHNKGFVVRTAVVDTDFEIPTLPKPRDRYAAKGNEGGDGARRWKTSVVEVFRRMGDTNDLEKICEYARDYPMFETFEPFRQGDRDYALISRNRSLAAVLDLASGEVIAEEDETAHGAGFCPVGFYVPDWWDVHDGSIIPGDEFWNPDREWPTSASGFVWGCHLGR